MHSSLNEAIRILREGIYYRDLIVIAKNVRENRESGEIDLDLYLSGIDFDEYLLRIKLFQGRKQHYKQWVEIRNIHNELIHLGSSFFGSDIEYRMYELFHNYLEPGGKLLIDYSHDIVTRNQLRKLVPPVLTRMGWVLLKVGFTQFRDLFVASSRESRMELAAEKEFSYEDKVEKLKKIRREIENWINSSKKIDKEEKCVLSALCNVKFVMNYIEKYL